MNKPNKLEDVLEGYKPIPMKRLFYPRGMRLSEDFVNAFHREYDRLVDEGINPRALVERFGKAMAFHVNDPRKYKLLDEESKKQRDAKEQAAQKKRTHKQFRQASKKEIRDEEKPASDNDSAVEGRDEQ